MVNGAAYGDLSSEKVYVKLQRMTCAQPGGRFAVSEVKGFIAFGGKVGVRGRVVSKRRVAYHAGVLAGLVSSAGSAINGSLNRIRSSPMVAAIRPALARSVCVHSAARSAGQTGTSVSEYLPSNALSNISRSSRCPLALRSRSCSSMALSSEIGANPCSETGVDPPPLRMIAKAPLFGSFRASAYWGQGVLWLLVRRLLHKALRVKRSRAGTRRTST